MGIINTSYTYHFLDANNFFIFPFLIVLNDVLCFCLKVTIYNTKLSQGHNLQNQVLSQGHNLQYHVLSQGHNLQHQVVSRSQSTKSSSVSRSQPTTSSCLKVTIYNTKFCLKVTIYSIMVPLILVLVLDAQHFIRKTSKLIIHFKDFYDGTVNIGLIDMWILISPSCRVIIFCGSYWLPLLSAYLSYYHNLHKWSLSWIHTHTHTHTHTQWYSNWKWQMIIVRQIKYLVYMYEDSFHTSKWIQSVSITNSSGWMLYNKIMTVVSCIPKNHINIIYGQNVEPFNVTLGDIQSYN